ncbi:MULTISPECIES: caspase family protein [Nitrosomonas]|uniref:Sel1 repeat-containing protein n=1 Tax=Nitrosomonas communis TaxID=44574 RepID=A0A5D3YKX2_9PROT|nr:MULTISPECIES: caspase family protein [Nitrosomonas]TYP94267.1 Sel1 repeat-containing protein [Nitrosomonas communis]UVS60844.1 caspase family protein [Nitrosomonas sp. PLL12]
MLEPRTIKGKPIVIFTSQASQRWPQQCACFLLSLLSAYILISCASSRSIHTETEINAENVNKLQIIDCLLPGQLRQLGTSMTYLTARRPLRTSAADCEIRGGEYAAFDRANYATALKIWLPKASEGDAEAQTYVGEIYEKGLGIAPDYAMAAVWYRKAAEQGNPQAQTNLGYLYEKGLGVVQDPIMALNWYRKASGLENTDIAFSASVEASNAEIDKLRQQVSQYKIESAHHQQESAALKERLSDTRQQLNITREQLKQRKQDLLREQKAADQIREELQQKLQQIDLDTTPNKIKSSEIVKFEQALKQKEAELELSQRIIDKLENEAQEQSKNLNVLKEGTERLTIETNRELTALRTELEQSKVTSAQLESELQQTQIQLSSSQNALSEKNDHLKKREEKLKVLQEELNIKRKNATTAQDNTEVENLSKALNDLELAFQSQKQTLDKLNKERATLIKQSHEKQRILNEKNEQIKILQERITREKKEKTLPEVATNKLSRLTGPQIEIIEPPLILHSGTLSINTRSGLAKRTIIGKVTAPAGLVSLVVNDKEEAVDKSGVFKVNVPLVSVTTPIEIVAVDQNSKRTEMKFTIEQSKVDMQSTVATSTFESSSESSLKSVLPHSLFGKYYSLLIGNNTYSKLPHLATAINDVESIAKILKSKYGFETKVLLNANRYDILKALNDYRKILTEKDNLLVYYAGHGILDKVNDRGHWLPVDAEPDSSANWISVENVTDQLKIIEARHVLVVADSCYSGSLTRSSVARLEGNMTTEKRAHWIKSLLNARSRLALSSGGLEPVLDGGGGNHSVFAKAFIATLTKNNDIMESQALYRKISGVFADAAKEYDFQQVPEYAPIRHAGHGAGEFFFYPR